MAVFTNGDEVSLWQTFERLSDSRDRLLDASPNDEAIDDAAEEIEKRLDDLEQRTTDLSTTIALLGDTNAGKSTLINALMGGSVLPKSGVGVGTASMTSLTYRPGDRFVAEVQFATRGELTQQCMFLLDNQTLDAADGGVDMEFVEMLDAVGRRLWRIYGESLALFLATGQLASLREEPDVAAALGEGRRIIDAASAADLRTQLVDYVDSSGSSAQIVKHVAIRGPFDALRTGATVIDLPGLNDPDAHRTAVTQLHVARADLVWIVFPIDVGVARSLIRAIQTMLPLHELLLEGRSSRLAFVVTKCDHVDVDDARKVGVDPTSDLDGFLAARRQLVERDLRDKLELLVRPLRQQLGSVAGEAIARLQSAPIYFVSGLDHLKLTGHETGAPTFPALDLTQVTELTQQLERIGAQRTSADALAELTRDLELIEAAIDELLAGRLAAENETDVEDADDIAIERFTAEIETAVTTFDQELEQACDELITAADDVADASFVSVDEVVEKWSQLSPKTLLATVQRDGLFVGHGGARHDMNADVAEAFLVALYPAWSGFFEEMVPALIRGLQGQLVASTERALADLGATEATAEAVHSRFFEREASALIDRERVEIIGAVIEALREELREDYRSLLQTDEPLTKQEVVQGVATAVLGKQTALRDASTDELDTWLGDLVENLGQLVRDEIDARRDRLRQITRPD
ncbi:MAG TPA: dynamin family protein [Acidimicrobiales bacterium]|nr:dynamin family protein [Acidimicrobiales bacterium]